MDNTMEMRKRITQAAWATWDAIGGELMEITRNSTGRDSMERNDIMDYILDANYLETYGGDPGVVEWFRNLVSEDRYGIMREIFVEERYSWNKR